MIAFCSRPDCHNPAVGGNLSAEQVRAREQRPGGDPSLAEKALPNGLCREHLVEHAKRDAVRCEVVGDAAVVGVDGEPVGRGGTVELHPAQTDIGALVFAGLVQVAPDKRAAKSEPAKSEKSG